MVRLAADDASNYLRRSCGVRATGRTLCATGIDRMEMSEGTGAIMEQFTRASMQDPVAYRNTGRQ